MIMMHRRGGGCCTICFKKLVEQPEWKLGLVSFINFQTKMEGVDSMEMKIDFFES